MERVRIAALLVLSSLMLFASVPRCSAEEPPPAPRRPEKPTAAEVLQAANTGTIAPPPEPYGQYSPSAPGLLSSAQMIALAAEYAWNEDYGGERSWLAAAAQASTDRGAGIAQVLLAEASAFLSERDRCQALLAQVRDRYRDPEVLAFADLVEALCGLTPREASHGRRIYSNPEDCRARYAEAAAKWKGSYLGAWVSIRLAAVYRMQLDQPKEAIAVLDQTIATYAGTPFAEYATEEKAAAVTFSLNDFETGRQLYEGLLATTSSEYVAQRAGLHYAELLMDTQEFPAAHEGLNTFITRWPGHAKSVGAYALRGFVAANLALWEEAEADSKDYLATTAAKLPAYTGKAHLTLGDVAYQRKDLAEAEREFALVDDPYLIPSAKARTATCRADQGDYRGAMTNMLAAAEALTVDRGWAPAYLYQAARLARKIGDQATFEAVRQQMISEFPRDYFTTLLVGHEVAPAPAL